MLFNYCKQPTAQNGLNIIERSIQAHGGWEAYEALDTLVIKKTIRLFDASEILESETLEQQIFIFKPHYQTVIVRTADSTSYDGTFLEKHIGDSILFDEEKRKQDVKRIKAAEFVFFQPFKLRDSIAEIEFIDIQKWDAMDVSEVKVTYPNSTDIWWFYFDDTYLCVANKVTHNDRISRIENLEFQEYKGLLLHKHRKSYFVDSLGTEKRLRAEYFYEIIR